MDKKSLKLLEKVYCAEIDGALSKSSHLYQTKSNLAVKLVESGHLAEETMVIGHHWPVTVRGYVLTHLGRMEYCMSV